MKNAFDTAGLSNILASPILKTVEHRRAPLCLLPWLIRSHEPWSLLNFAKVLPYFRKDKNSKFEVKFELTAHHSQPPKMRKYININSLRTVVLCLHRAFRIHSLSTVLSPWSFLLFSFTVVFFFFFLILMLLKVMCLVLFSIHMQIIITEIQGPTCHSYVIILS